MDSPIIRLTECRSILNRSGIPGVDFALNPYVGCLHGCVYCYASFMKRFTGHTEPWGKFVDVKCNAPYRLMREARHKRGKLMISSVTDAYQPVEACQEITRSCLEILVGLAWFEVSILTKSDLVLRDVDLLKRIPHCSVGFTITSPEDRISGLFEPGASPTSARIRALSRLIEEGIDVWAFFGPVIPFFSDSDGAIRELLKRLQEAGVRRVLVDRMNLYPQVRAKLHALGNRRLPRGFNSRLLEMEEDPGRYEFELRDSVVEIAGQLGLSCELVF